jgi:hypothetical protein
MGMDKVLDLSLADCTFTTLLGEGCQGDRAPRGGG